MPCFEEWFFLHIKYSTRLFTSYKKLEPEIKKFLPNYQKSKNYFTRNNVYQKLLPKKNTAIENAKKLIKNKPEYKKSFEYPKCDIFTIFERLLKDR